MLLFEAELKRISRESGPTLIAVVIGSALVAKLAASKTRAEGCECAENFISSVRQALDCEEHKVTIAE